MMLLWSFNFSRMSFLILHLLKCLVWNCSCQEDTFPSQSTHLPLVHRQEKAQALGYKSETLTFSPENLKVSGFYSSLSILTRL